MTGDVNFSGKIAKKIELKDIAVENLNTSKKEKLDDIFDGNKSGDSKDALTVDELVKSIASIDKDKDGKLSDSEMAAAWEALPESKKQGIEKTEYVAYIRSLAQKNEELAKDNNIGNGYTIQLGEDLDDLVERVLKSQGVSEPTAAQKEKCKQSIIDNNPNSMKIENGKVKWLLAGSKIYLPTDTSSSKAKKSVEDQNNFDTVIERYNKWKRGEIKSFRYRVDDSGNQYEVRTDSSEYKYGTADGGVISSSGRVVDVDLVKAVDVQKLKGGKIGDEKYSDETVRDLAQKGLNVLAELKESDNIKNVTKNEKEKSFDIELKSGSHICVYYDDQGKITRVRTIDSKDDNACASFLSNGKLFVNTNGDDKFDFFAKHGVKDFGVIEKLIKSHDVVREKIGLPKRDIVDFSMITDSDLGDNDRDDVETKIKTANEIIAGLEITSDIESVKTEDKDSHKEKTIIMKNGTVVIAYIDNKGTVYKVNVKRSGVEKVDVTYDLKDDENKITVDFKGGKEPVEIYDAIKNTEAVKSIVKEVNNDTKVVNNDTKGEKESAKAEKKAASGEDDGDAKIEERISPKKAKEIAKKYYKIAQESTGDVTARRILQRAVKEIKVNNVVEIWEACLNQKGDASLISTITSEWISNGQGGGRDMAVQTAKHILEQLVKRAEEVGVSQGTINDTKLWLEGFDFTPWINDEECLPGKYLTADDDDLGDVLEPVIARIVKEIKERESLPDEERAKQREFTREDAIAYGKTLYGYAKDFYGDDAPLAINYSIQKTVTKDNAAKIWMACREGGGVQKTDASLISTMTSEMLSNSIGRFAAVNACLHIMEQLITKARELDVDEDIINDVEECYEYDYTGWINDNECLPGNYVTADDDDLGDWLEPRLDSIARAIEKKEAKSKE